MINQGNKPKRSLLKGIQVFFKTNLIAGLLFLTPLVATFFFLRMLIQWMDRILLVIPKGYRPEDVLPFPIPGMGLIIIILLLLVTGILVRNYLGRRLVAMWDYIVAHIPLVNKFYVSVQQLVETVAKGGTKDFKRVVLVEFPRTGVYSLAYVTGVAVGELQEKTHRKVINLYVPTTPNPTSGYYLIVAEDEVIELDMTVEDSFKLLISGGIINPDMSGSHSSTRKGPRTRNKRG
ncbi:MAG: hypothetical protein CSA21_05670 [Deltaproteobacteria bacterium]|nr:MAG: hypothetical protein CSA21_05670 [Deltaproteobacteria bacterium]